MLFILFRKFNLTYLILLLYLFLQIMNDEKIKTKISFKGNLFTD